MGEQATVAVEAWLRAIGLCADALPGGFARTGPHGTTEIITGLPVPSLNGVFAVTGAADVAEVSAYAGSPRLATVPWSVQVRDDDAERFAPVAARHGLARRMPLPFMLAELTGPVDADPAVRRVSGADGDLYRKALADGYEAPESIFDGFSGPALLDHPAMRAYVVEVAGTVVATSFGVLVGDQIGIFNIAVPPEHRRRGYGRAATAAVLRDGYAAGARHAFLHATELGEPLYESMGFRTAQTWAVFLPA
ncbi:GNAT family N-acetyltransferase [Asanoa sp. NPDC049573]|uniref:GNAT family N-acetyltransferase n=1 Tax=Asanoa sp. NPDC049573 TaxID=3155396 RepID=UPI00344089D2